MANVIRDLVLSLDTSAYTAGDVLAATQELLNALGRSNLGGTIRGIGVVDRDDVGAEMTILIMNAATSIGNENAAPNIADGDAATILGIVEVETSDYIDLGGARYAYKTGLNIPVAAAAAKPSLYVAVINGAGTPTFTAAGITLKFAIEQDDG